MRTLAAPTRWNLRKPEIGSAGAERRALWFSCGHSRQAWRIGCHQQYGHTVETRVETIAWRPQHFSTGRPPKFAHRGCEPVARTTGANWPSTSARMRTSSAYLAAHHSRITHRACVKIVRDGLRETGQVSSKINPTRGYQGGYRPICAAPASRPDVDKCWHGSGPAPLTEPYPVSKC